MRDRLQMELLPGEYRDRQKRERERLLAELKVDLARARMRREPWLVWVENRRNGVHDHDAKRDDGSPAACPFPGCDARRGAP